MLTVTTTEPRFTRAEVDLLLASMLAEEEPRGAHGHLMSEATAPENQFAYYTDDLPVRDYAQEALNAAHARYRKQWGKAADDVVPLFAVKKRD